MSKTKLISKGDSRYEVDEFTFIDLDETFTTDCDDPHPHKERVDRIRARYTDPAAADRYIASLYNHKIITKHTSEGWVQYVTYLCPGGEQHNYSQWVVSVNGDWTEDVYDTFTQARGALEAIIGPTTLVRQKKQPKQPEIIEDPNTGRRRWAKCGHPAEFDIDRNCYVCHGNPA